MKTIIHKISLLTILLFSLYLGDSGQGVPAEAGFRKLNMTPCSNEENEENEGSGPLKGPELERWYFSDWHQPYGNVLPSEKLQQMWTDISKLPSERETDNMIPGPWRCIGPYGMRVNNPNIKHSGRILDILAYGGPLEAGSASGGLWKYDSAGWIPLADSLTSLSVGAFLSQGSLIFVGTGEPYVRRGTGLWRTVDAGQNWSNIPMNSGNNPNPKWFYKIAPFPTSNGTVGLAATDTGLYRSTDVGLTWTRVLGGEATDVVGTFDTVFTAIWGGTSQGIWKSENGGLSWALLGGGAPTSNVGRTSLSISFEYNSFAVYASVARLDNNGLLGVYRTGNRGITWTSVTSNLPNILGTQGWYDNIVSSEINHIDTVVIGGVSLWRSFDGGGSWTQINDTNVHADNHRASFYGSLFECNDGGLSYSSNGGLTWTTQYNFLPITQYYGFDVGKTNPNVVFGGAQDNGISGTVNGGTNWTQSWYPGIGGDGGGISIDPNNASNIFGILGAYGGGILFQRFSSTNAGQSWTAINGGITADGNWAPMIRCERNNPQTLYTNANDYVYKSTDGGNSWAALNTTGFTYNVTNVNVSIGAGTPVVYACLNSTDAANKLKVYDGGIWNERSTGLPVNARVRTVAQHPNNNNRAYALMNGLGVPPTQGPHKIFKTFNRGVTWIDITGDLPDIPIGDLVPHPTDTNILYLGTEMGCYKTLNGGASWIRWNTGMPKANIITEMTYIDSSAQNGRFYIFAASFGRSIWIRQIDETITGITKNNNGLPEKFALYQNYPNPFNPVSKIKYQIAKTSEVKIAVYDILGKEVAVIVNEVKNPGSYEITFDGTNFSSGIYFYKLESNGFTDTKKMMLIK